MVTGGVKTKNIAREIKGADLAPAIVKQLVGPHRAAFHFVDVIGRLTLTVDFSIAGKAHCGTHHVESAAHFAIESAVSSGNGARSGLDVRAIFRANGFG